MKTVLTLILVLTFSLPSQAVPVAGTCNSKLAVCKATAASPGYTIPVVELYTSQGCSSCPPAEAFLLRLYRNGYASKVIPLAFHVDYWDYIGWKDPYASKRWSIRQRNEARRLSLRTVYTPQFIFYGLNFLSYPNLGKAIDVINKTRPRASIRLQASLRGNLLSVRSQVLPASKTLGNSMEVFFALSENNLSDQVRRGENAGRKLENDFVVRAFRKIGSNSEVHLPLPSGWKRQNLNVVVYARDRDSGETYQSILLPLRLLR